MSIPLKLLHCGSSGWPSFTIGLTEMITGGFECFLRLHYRVGRRWSSTPLRRCRSGAFHRFLRGRLLFLDGPHRSPRSAAIGGTVNSEIRSQVDYVGITRVLKDRVGDET